jgi:thiamine biosynthesis protein ThiS
MSTIAVTINGETRRIPGPATLLQLLEHLGLDPRTVVVELNREIVRRPRLGQTAVADGDASRAGAFRRGRVTGRGYLSCFIPSAARDLARDRPNAVRASGPGRQGPSRRSG